MVAQSSSPERPTIFLSYSRQELYFAEAVVQELTQSFDVWFDVQRLKPGLDWDAEIKQGNDQCAALVLVASESSLHSPNVADEWERVLFERKRPVYLLVFESVRFEPFTVPGTTRVLQLDQLKAKAAGIIDCRSGFRRNVKRLTKALQERLAANDTLRVDGLPAPIPNDPIATPITFTLRIRGREMIRVHVPTRVSWAVGLVIAALILNVVGVVYVTVTLFWVNWASTLLGIIIAVLLTVQLLEFLSRRFSYNQVRWTLLLVGFLAALMIGQGDVLLIVQVLLCAVTLLLMTFSKELLYWAPRGQGPTLLRQGVLPFGRFRRRFSTTSTGKKYVIHADPADRRITDTVRTVMNRAGFTEGWVIEGKTTDIRLCLLSNTSSPEDFAAVGNTSDQLVWIVASHLPDIRPYTVYEKRQWVDFRSQNVMMLRGMAEELRPDAEDRIYRELSINVTPQDFRLRIVPASISFLNLLIFLIGMLIAGSVSFASTIILATTANPVLIVFFLIVPLLIDVILIRYSNRLISRDIQYRGCATLFLLLTAVLAVAAALAFAPLLVIPLWLIYLIIVSLRLWLPIVHTADKRRDYFGFRRDGQLWRRNVFFYGVAAIVVFGLGGNMTFVGTPRVPVAATQFAAVSPAPHLSLSLPTHWLTRTIPDEAALSQFGWQTQINPPFSAIEAAAAHLPYAGENDVISRLHAGPNVGALGQLARLQWVALEQPTVGLEYILLSVWKISENNNPADVLAARKAELVESPPADESISLMDEIAAGDGSVSIPCFHIKVSSLLFTPPLFVHEDWYCSVSASASADYIVYLQAGVEKVEEERPIILQVLNSLSVSDSEPTGAN